MLFRIRLLTDLEKLEEGMLHDRGNGWINLVLVQSVHTLYITATVVNLTLQLEPMNIIINSAQTSTQTQQDYHKFLASVHVILKLGTSIE